MDTTGPQRRRRSGRRLLADSLIEASHERHTKDIPSIQRDVGKLTHVSLPTSPFYSGNRPQLRPGACKTRVCLKIAFRQLCVPLRGRFGPDEGGVAGYVDRIGTKYAAKWGVQMAGMNFQTRSRRPDQFTSRNMAMVLKNTGKADTVKSWYHVTGMEKYYI